MFKGNRLWMEHIQVTNYGRREMETWKGNVVVRKDSKVISTSCFLLLKFYLLEESKKRGKNYPLLRASVVFAKTHFLKSVGFVEFPRNGFDVFRAASIDAQVLILNFSSLC